MDKEIQSNKKIKVPRILIMGVGSSGSQAVLKLYREHPEMNVLLVDSDASVLEACGDAPKIHLGASIMNGFSAGGDEELGRQSAEKSSQMIRSAIKDVDLLIVVAGLGGGTGTGALPVITRIANETTMVLCMVSMPFAFEGSRLKQKAELAVKKVRSHAHAIVQIPYERLMDVSESDLPIESILLRGEHLLQEAVVSLWRMLLGGSVYGLDFASLQTMLHNCDGFCSYASASVEGPDRAKMAVEDLLSHRLLKDGKMLEEAAGMVVGLTGGSDLTLVMIETVMSQLHAVLPKDTWVNFGLIVDPLFENKLSVVLLVAEQWKEPLVMDASGRQLGFSFRKKAKNEQGELLLEIPGQGCFSADDPTVYENQNLDQPTYIRRGIKLPR